MRLRRRVLQAGLVVVGLSLLAAPVTAQSVNRAAIDDLNEQLLYVALPLTLFVELTLVYVIYRFRNNDDPKPTVDDPALEVTWTAATGAILVFVGVSAFVVMANPYITPAAAEASAGGGDAFAEDTQIDVLAYQWGWEFSYGEASVTTEERLVLPADKNVTFRLRTTDVIHAIYIPQLGVKQDIFPGRTMTARTHATEPGEYRLYCAEMCGAGHSKMDATVVVKNQSGYDAWMENQTTAAG
ncbi:cytochrome c oxidase subunit II [Haloarcula marismortui ATCC 43049]|uniref:cytochrome-c oxidase n=1 Tax=Haloarcula marismortui (strain ATCC 43049 / DSM 3752 / JCM 8966 / VKM B-1809) TaxID=272569 RepID=Q5V3P5_HALMA|nr:cytochrome c oxidase subunit II [Haloarcula marismortui]AAV45857.1 cytochrome c oxidase subunit II [Haloarcula marismortui ATCC 43049]QCP90630.1 cytochrome c oxidase subunit II [Haloarcula marismortui ATCC 43049]